jgi:hypothetical protein
LNYKDKIFAVASMMDENDTAMKSRSYKASCALRVQEGSMFDAHVSGVLLKVVGVLAGESIMQQHAHYRVALLANGRCHWSDQYVSAG